MLSTAAAAGAGACPKRVALRARPALFERAADAVLVRARPFKLLGVVVAPVAAAAEAEEDASVCDSSSATGLGVTAWLLGVADAPLGVAAGEWLGGKVPP